MEKFKITYEINGHNKNKEIKTKEIKGINMIFALQDSNLLEAITKIEKVI